MTPSPLSPWVRDMPTPPPYHSTIIHYPGVGSAVCAVYWWSKIHYQALKLANPIGHLAA